MRLEARYLLPCLDDELRQQTMLNATEYELRETAQKGAYMSLPTYARFVLTSGITTAEEALAVVSGTWTDEGTPEQTPGAKGDAGAGG